MVKKNVFDFIAERVSSPVNEDTIFFDDLNIDGLDAETLMMEIAQEYNVDLSKYDSSKYHLSEYEMSNVLLVLYKRIFTRGKNKIIKFTGSHLLNVLEKGEWFDPDIDSSMGL